jgi:cytochrome c-type biogenesis protein CcmE
MEKRSKNRLIVVTVIILGLLAALLFLATRGENNLAYFKTVTELKEDTSLIGKSVRVGGEVVKGSIKKSGTKATFKISDKKSTITIEYVGNAQLPATLTDDVQVIAEGIYTKNDLVEADSIVTKCPSKYENKKIETE